jgi:hypothetical protein
MPTMPNCVGLGWQQATAALIQAGVTPDNGLLPAGNFVALGYFDTWPVVITWQKTTAAKPGIVTAQLPAAAATVAFRAAVNLTVSAPPMPVADRYSAGGYS